MFWLVVTLGVKIQNRALANQGHYLVQFNYVIQRIICALAL